MKPSRAIILSAGQGKRLLPLTEDRPKCLLEFSGRTLLAWQLIHLEAAGITEAVVVTGFRADAVQNEVKRLNLRCMDVRLIFNPFYAVSDNLASCWMARAEFDREMLLLNGDTLFEQAVAECLMSAAPAEITVAVDRKTAYDTDDMKVLTDDIRLLAIGKTLEAYDGESIGFLRFSSAGAGKFSAGGEAVLRQPEGLRRWYLSVVDQLARSSADVRIQSVEGLAWGELDFPHDLDNLERVSAPWTKALATQTA